MPTRRAVLASLLAAAAFCPDRAGAETGPAESADDTAAPRTIMRLHRRVIEVNGKPASVYGIHQPDGTNGLTTQAGKPFRVRLENHIDEPSLIHWHGMTPPWQQDGVPGISGPPIPPGGIADYDFPLRFGGTFWMHSHQGLQEQLLMTAPLIIRDARERPDRQEVVVVLNDFSFTPPEQILETLTKGGAMPKMAGAAPRMTGMGGMPGMKQSGGAGARDLNDVKYDAFLANDRTLADPEIVKVEPGAPALLRVINASSMTNFHIDLGRLNGALVAVDGFAVVPVPGRRFPVVDAQRLDIELTVPSGNRAYPVLAIVEGERRQTGIVLAAGHPEIVRVPEMAGMPSPPVSLDLEQRLRAVQPLKPRKADRVHTLNLTGEMMGYVWSINNVVWNDSVAPLPVKEGERVELVMINRTAMSHPMHLHGHQFQVVEINGKRLSGAVRDTVLVPPNRRVVLAFEANNPGHWAFHCHLLYHMHAGMFATFRYV